MLQIIKEVLINEKQEELARLKKIGKITKRLGQENKKELLMIDQDLEDISKKINKFNSNVLFKLTHKKELKDLSEEYNELRLNRNNKLDILYSEIDLLFENLYGLLPDYMLLKKEINKLKKANSLEDLSLTEDEAARMIKEYSKKDELIIIKAVFSNIKNNEQLKTKEDIFRIMQNLYQTNSSSFSSAIKKILPIDLIDLLSMIDIFIDEEKIKILNDLTAYILDTNNKVLINRESTDKLDIYFYNEVEKAINNIEDYPKFRESTISKIMTLTVLVSIAKNNKEENIKNKGVCI